MTLEEELINEGENNIEVTPISPRMIGPQNISIKKLDSIKNESKQNSTRIIDSIITNLIQPALERQKENYDYLELKLILLCNRKELSKLFEEYNTIADLIMNNADKIIALYKCYSGSYNREYWVNGLFTETISKYNYNYIDFKMLLERLKENHINYSILHEYDRNDDEAFTKFIISYNPKKQKEAEGPKLKKIKKERK